MNDIRRNTFFWGLILGLLMVSGILFSPFSGDAPYYLSTARDISHGLVPYRDINLSYTPLMMYLNAIIWFVVSQPHYSAFIIFQYLIILCSAFILYKIALRMSLSKAKATFISIFFSICILSSDGHFINLEVYSILFVLLSYLSLIQKRFLLCGFLLALTFFCKQYGILNFIPFLLLLVFAEGFKFKPILQFCIGGIIPLLFFIGYFCVVKETAFQNLLMQLTGQGYGEKNIAETKTLFGFLNGAKVFILMLVPLCFYKFNPFTNTMRMALVIAILVMLLPVAVQSFQHYFLNAFPYIAILLITLWKQDEIQWRPVHVSLAIVSVLLILRIVNHAEKRETQRIIAEVLSKEYPKGSIIYLKGTINYLYISNDYSNPVLKDVGYSYIFKTSREFLKNHTVLSFDRVGAYLPNRIISINGKKVYEY